MKVKLLDDALCPKRGREGDAGYDLFLIDNVTFLAHSITTIDTGVCVELPTGHAGLLAMRSSVCKTGLIIQQPLIDENYRGQLHVIIVNPTDTNISFNKGDRVCSLYVFPVYHDELEIVEDLSESNRGTSWNGSSGK